MDDAVTVARKGGTGAAGGLGDAAAAAGLVLFGVGGAFVLDHDINFDQDGPFKCPRQPHI